MLFAKTIIELKSSYSCVRLKFKGERQKQELRCHTLNLLSSAQIFLLGLYLVSL